MPNRKKDVNTGRKYNLIQDEFGVSGSGIYGITASENKDLHRRLPIKIGMSMALEKRVASYSGYFPQGVYTIGLLSNIPIPRATRKRDAKSEHGHLLEIENFIRDYAAARDNSKVLRCTDRTRKLVDSRGVTERVY